jgi:gamma-glutamyltranspeptidase
VQAQRSMGDGRVRARRALADPEFAAVPVERLTSKAYAEEARRAIDRGETFAVPRWRAHETGTT